MRSSILLLALLFLPGYALAQETKATDTKAAAKVEAKAAKAETPATQPAPKPAPVDPSVKQPTSADEAMDAGKDFVGALKAKRWWFASAVGIFLLLFILGVFKLWAKIGTTWAWVAVGVLSLAAGVFAAFDKGGFSWSTLLGYMTAGPTIAWLRDFVKDGLLKKKEG